MELRRLFFILALTLAVLAPQFAFAKDGDSGGSNSGSGSSNSGSGSSNSGSGHESVGDDEADIGGSTNSISSGNDQNRARDALDKKAVRPVKDVLAAALREVPGRVLGVTLRNNSGDYIYRIRILDRGGRKHDVLMSGRSLRVIRIR